MPLKKPPIRHFGRADPRNLDAARARIAELGGAAAISGRRKWDAPRLRLAELLRQAHRDSLEVSIRHEPSERADRLVAPMEVIEKSWVKRHPRGIRPVQIGDPAPGRSALARYVLVGEGYDPSHSDSPRHGYDMSKSEARPAPSRPARLPGHQPWWGAAKNAKNLVGAAKAITEAQGCRFPIGDPKKPEFHFCNADKNPWRPYCEFHTRLCKRDIGCENRPGSGILQ